MSQQSQKKFRTIFKFEVGQDVALYKDFELSSWAATGEVFQISQRFKPHEQMQSQLRYRIQGLWFDEDEIFAVTKEKNPEYFL